LREHRIIKVRKEHSCEACNGIIKKGSLAYLWQYWLPNDKYPISVYYHYTGQFTVSELKRMTVDQIRENICSKFNSGGVSE